MKLIVESNEKCPFHVQLHITNRCNLKCIHCYEGSRTKVEEWEYSELLKLIEQLEHTFVKWNVDGEISIVGGEPTLYPYFNDLIYRIHNSDVIKRFAILTNGVFFDDETSKAIINTKPTVQISIDGIDEEHHDTIRGDGNYSKSISNIKFLSDNNVDVFIHYVISKYSTPITWEFIKKMESLGVKQITFSRDVPIGNSNKSIILDKYDIHKTFDTLNEFDEKLKKNNSKLKINTSRPLWACYNKSGRCPVGIQTITILHNGDVYPCRRLPILLGNIKTESLFSIWYNSVVLWNLRDRTKYNGCGNCELLDSCGGARCIAYAITGNYLEADPQCWRL